MEPSVLKTCGTLYTYSKMFSYRSTPCPNVKHGDDWGDPAQCEQGDNCPYCHTRTEQQFHPEVTELHIFGYEQRTIAFTLIVCRKHPTSFISLCSFYFRYTNQPM